jgi:elongation factor Ts
MVSAALIKELRERTGAGMMDCRKALEATGGDLDKAAEKLRMDGAAKADKKAGRVAAEGIIGIAEDASAVALVELNSETDFVAKGDDFQALARAAAETALKHRPSSIEALTGLSHGGQTLDQIRRSLVARIGENLTLRRFEIVKKGAAVTAIYVHPGSKIVSVVALDKGDAELAKDLSMHVAAASPRYLDAGAVPPDVLAAERKIIEAQTAEQAAGKPAEIVAKMVDGKLRKFTSEITLLGQPYVKDDKQTVESLLKSKSAMVVRFVRLAVGEGIEKKPDDFAAEVAAMARG